MWPWNLLDINTGDERIPISSLYYEGNTLHIFTCTSTNFYEIQIISVWEINRYDEYLFIKDHWLKLIFFIMLIHHFVYLKIIHTNKLKGVQCHLEYDLKKVFKGDGDGWVR